ncbi:choice-of-anchor L domain-containing protein [Agromyces aureus]|uniref:Peptidase n=1 Tax=Agromyces aureus TaxID=453304 RepID=A0A191WD09_9MICO|nr:choice-of-anchor L domain-containing protein [Agromyces aureus]ANJ26112.1 hypothetical protein ATC03_04545 [Agromyces aureus]
MNRTHATGRALRTGAVCTLAAASALGLAAIAAAPATAAGTIQTLRAVDATAVAGGIVGNGVKLVSATASGSDVQVGTYSGVDLGQAGLADGVALSTGSLVDADPQAASDTDFTSSALVGPNEKLTTTGDFGGAGDDDLTALVGATTYDAATLELTVVPAGDDLALRFLVGSEEYAGWASDFGDAVGVWVNGELCSVVPGTDTPVGTASINASTSPDLYSANFDDVTPGADFDTEFNGFTAAIDCTATVVAGAETTVKLAVADTRDGQLDTTLLVGAASITSTAPVEPTPTQPATDQPTTPGAGTASVGSTTATPTASKLSATGFDTVLPMILAAGALLIGAASVTAVKLRRRFATASPTDPKSDDAS